MSIEIYVLLGSKNVRLYADKLKSIAESTVALVKKSLPIDDVDIVIYENPSATIKEAGGIGGFSPNSHTVFVSLDTSHPDFDNSLAHELPFALAHELHHTIRWQKPVEGDMLLEALVFEGLAEHFAMEATGRTKPSPWACALTPEQKKIFFKKAMEEWEKPTYDNALWFFGSNPEVVPRWAGYTLGYDLVG